MSCLDRVVDLETLRMKYAESDRDFSGYTFNGSVLGLKGLRLLQKFMSKMEQDAPICLKNTFWIDFQGICIPFRGADFSGAVMKRVMFIKCCFDYACFKDVMYNEVKFFRCSTVGMAFEGNIDASGFDEGVLLQDMDSLVLNERKYTIRTFKDMPGANEKKGLMTPGGAEHEWLDSKPIHKKKSYNETYNVEDLLRCKNDEFDSVVVGEDMARLRATDAYDYMVKRFERSQQDMIDDARQNIVWEETIPRERGGSSKIDALTSYEWVLKNFGSWREGVKPGTMLDPKQDSEDT